VPPKWRMLRSIPASVAVRSCFQHHIGMLRSTSSPSYPRDYLECGSRRNERCALVAVKLYRLVAVTLRIACCGPSLSLRSTSSPSLLVAVTKYSSPLRSPSIGMLRSLLPCRGQTISPCCGHPLDRLLRRGHHLVRCVAVTSHCSLRSLFLRCKLVAVTLCCGHHP
jgi:hypothetical protein